jgi:hemerythrin-like domain-containing protein
MKRHAILRDLPTDHHHGLVHARRLNQAAEPAPAPGAPPPAAVAAEFLAFWARDTNHHFREEEEVLLPVFARYGDAEQAPIVRMLVDHVRIRRLVDDLRAGDPATPATARTMRDLGTALRAHIRWEEDVVFPLIEAALPEEALGALPARFAAFAAQEGQAPAGAAEGEPPAC